MAAGIAAAGLIPVVTCYAFAALRALEQIRNSIAYPDFNVKIVVSHLGLDVGPDGATHQTIEDIACLRAIPNMNVVAPADPWELNALLPTVLDLDAPVYLRTGRSPLPDVYSSNTDFAAGKAKQIKDGKDVALLATGVMVWRAIKAAEILKSQGIEARVVDLNWLKPIDEDAIIDAARHCRAIVTCEDHNKFGGLGGAVSETLAKFCPTPMEFVAIDDCFGQSGDPQELARAYHLHPADIVEAAGRVFGRKDREEISL